MNHGRTVFFQLMDGLPKYEFDQCVRRYRGNHRVRSLPSYEQFLVMAFAQLTYRESLRDIQTCLGAVGSKLYHSGIRQAPARSTLAAYALDSTTIDLCLSLFPWAKFRRTKAAIKLHTLLALRGNYPTVVIVTTGRVHDVNILDQLAFEPGSFYLFDRGYLDFARLHRLHLIGAFFVTRAKTNLRFRRRYSQPVGKSTGLRLDQTVVLTGFYALRSYPAGLRPIAYRDPLTGKKLVFLTNNFTVSALIIAQLYRCRWQIKLFFKWIKQHLRIKSFDGTSDNAVRTQVWIAIAVYVLVALLKKRLKLSSSLHAMLQILSLTLFEKTPLLQVFSDPDMFTNNLDHHNQPCLPGFLTGQ